MKGKDASALNKEWTEEGGINSHQSLESAKQQKIIVITSDGVEIEVGRQAAEKSNLIKDLIEDFGGDVDEPIPISNVNEQVMSKVIEWCEHETDYPSASAEDDTDAISRIKEWDAKFLQVDQDMLFEIILAANYLDIDGLFESSCKAVADKIERKPPEEICRIFDIDDHPAPKPDAPAGSPATDAQPTDGLPPRRTHHPTPTDVRRARRILQRAPLRSGKTVPPELALHIVSLGYRPRLAGRRTEERTCRANDHWRPGPLASAARLYLGTPPLPRPDARLGIVKIVPRRIAFRTWAADQGWATFGGDGTFRNSHTWFEASILRPARPEAEAGEGGDVALEDALPGTWETPGRAREALAERGWDFVEGDGGSVVWKVCSNITAKAEYSQYSVEWGRGVSADAEDDEAVGKGRGFLELLEPGCVVVLWARAEQQCWENHVERATIEIDYEVL